MRKLVFFFGLLSALSLSPALRAQAVSSISTVRVYAIAPGARFYVVVAAAAGMN